MPAITDTAAHNKVRNDVLKGLPEEGPLDDIPETDPQAQAFLDKHTEPETSPPMETAAPAPSVDEQIDSSVEQISSSTPPTDPVAVAVATGHAATEDLWRKTRDVNGPQPLVPASTAPTTDPATTPPPADPAPPVLPAAMLPDPPIVAPAITTPEDQPTGQPSGDVPINVMGAPGGNCDTHGPYIGSVCIDCL